MSNGDFFSIVSVRSIVVLDSNGERIISKHYTGSSQDAIKAFEKDLWNKTKSRTNVIETDVLVQEQNVTVYRRVGDTIFYVTGSEIENELILDSVLGALVNTLTTLLEFVSKSVLFEYFDVVLLVVDEMIDAGVILESDPEALTQRILSCMKRDTNKFDINAIEQKTKKLKDFLSQF